MRILRRIRQVQYPQPIFGVQKFDNLIPNQFSTTTQEEPDVLEQLLSRDTLKKSTLVELSSYSPASGKTAFLGFLVAHAIAPTYVAGVDIGGRNGAIVLVDNDDRFDVSVVYNNIKALIRPKLEQAIDARKEILDSESSPSTNQDITALEIANQDENLDSFSRKCLQHLHIVRPQSWASLIAGLEDLPDYLINKPQWHASYNKELISMIVDGANAFSWQRRADEESLKTQSLDADLKLLTPTVVPGYGTLISQLRELGRRFDCPVIATTIQQPKTNRDAAQQGSLAPANACIEVERSPVRMFPNCISYVEASDLRTLRQQAVEKHEFRVSKGNDGFTFSMRDDGTIALESTS